tara:strand:+ start:850 stop:1011 length:162 start_codon:yes stop_codon:yes gene_type:complete
MAEGGADINCVAPTSYWWSDSVDASWEFEPGAEKSFQEIWGWSGELGKYPARR